MNIANLVYGFLISLFGVMFIMPLFIDVLKKRNISQTVSEYSLEEYKQKAKTPIMGGLLFVVIPSVVYIALDINGFLTHKMAFILLSYVLFCLVGFLDDLLIIIRKNNDGVSPLKKLIMEFIFTLVLYALFNDVITTYITIPFTNAVIDLGILYVPFMILLFLAEANAVNFTDGMDGLCAGVSFIGLLFLFIMCYTNSEYSICLLIICVLGGLLGYLKFNFHPAKIFMGDSGSLALGALFSAICVVINKEVALAVIGCVFVLEMACVVIQQVSVRAFHKRVFSYTPIHYAFSLKGYKEVKIVIGFYLVSFIFGLIGLFIGLH